MVMVANPEPIKRISTCYPPPASSTQSVSDLWWELLLPIKDVDWQLLSIQRFPENAIAPNPSPASCHKGWRLVSPQICRLISSGQGWDLLQSQWTSWAQGVSAEGFTSLGPVAGVGQGLLAQPAQVAGDLLHEAGQMFLPAGQRHVN